MYAHGVVSMHAVIMRKWSSFLEKVRRGYKQKVLKLNAMFLMSVFRLMFKLENVLMKLYFMCSHFAFWVVRFLFSVFYCCYNQ